MIPVLDIAKLLASHGVKCTVVTTTLNAPIFTKAIHKTQHLGYEITLKIIKFPAVEAGLPQDCESADKTTSEKMTLKFFKTTAMLQDPFEKILRDVQPQCLVADMFFPWATHVAAKFGIPRLSFFGTSFFSLCSGESLRLYKPHIKASSDSELFKILGLPDTIKLTRRQTPDINAFGNEPELYKWKESCEADERKICHSLMLLNCAELRWLEATGKPLIWVVGKSKDGYENDDCLPSGFEKRMKDRGLITRGWAPQLLIPKHKAVGAFVTNCGWIEGISSGVPLLIWPLFAEQFLNEKLVTQVLRIGVSVGAQPSARFGGETVKSERIEEAINRVLEGEQAEKIRSQAKECGDLAKKAYKYLKALIEELKYEYP
ncbi:UDP-glucuronosyl/UDP-glucosyltransferase [Dillenia turbinata]|uniref:UDP-glucuronosyl/UDP-glucosyltransferase n=1 Tax=Dillenia turbinata TaxID=194707 RepID=A0AAN8WHF9_9MAGN